MMNDLTKLSAYDQGYMSLTLFKQKSISNEIQYREKEREKIQIGET